MNENKVNNESSNEQAKTGATATPAPETQVNAELKAAEEALKAADKTSVSDLPNVEPEECEKDVKGINPLRGFSRRLTADRITHAEDTDVKPTNPVRKGEVVMADDCSGVLKDFKKALMEGLIRKPDGLDKVSYRCNGFVKRDGSEEGSSVLAAKQFVTTLRISGRWIELPRYLASPDGGQFAIGASQTLKAARTLSAILHAVWVKGVDPKTLTTRKSAKK